MCIRDRYGKNVDGVVMFVPGIFQLAADVYKRQVMSNVATCILTIFWIVAITNAINLVDGLDGLAAGIGILSG